MGSSFDTWNDVAGAYYMGASSSWEVIWLVVSIVFCVWALVLGSRHELDAYNKAEKDD